VFEFSDLRDQLASYLTEEQVALISEAYLFAEKAHEGQHRSSGEPFITHPLEVAHILSAMHMDHQSIMAAILHDVIEDTHLDKAAVAFKFGDEVADLVDGLSKLDVIKFETHAEAQAENLRKMMLAMAQDIRVILVKLADRLHNLRTLGSLPREKQRRIARETLEIYAPIASRLGMNNFRIEFEDIGFSFLYPVRYRVLKEAVKKARGNRKEVIHALEDNLKNRLEQDGIVSFIILGREKHLYSLYRKMRKKDLSLSEIMDVYALRVLVDKVDTAYRVLGVAHNLYKPIHGRFKDYIAVPKSNGYQSLHTTVVGPFGVPVEIQIRTEEMDRMAENGIAAHWLYKSTKDAKDGEAETRAREWLKSILEIQKKTRNSLEFIEHVKVDLYPDEVYVFTPSGDILSLQSGATAVDFAYAVHTDVGNTCIAVKIDRRLVPLSTRLTSGQTIEIITTEGAHPNPAWLSFVVTGKARSNIRHWLKTQQYGEAKILGKRLLERALAGLSLSLDNIPKEQMALVLRELKFENSERLFEEVGLGNQVAALIARRLAEVLNREEQDVAILPLAIRGTEGMVVTYAKCCHPIPGDSIVGHLSSGRGIVIHRENCKNMSGMHKCPEKYIFVKWADNIQGEFLVEIRIEILNQRGALATLANVLADNNANIEDVHIDECDSHHNSIIFLVHIQNRQHLNRIIKQLRAVTSVTRVWRGK